MRGIPAAQFDCVVTDPPYSGFGFTSKNYVERFKPFADEIVRCAGNNHRLALSQPTVKLRELAVMLGSDSVVRIDDAFEDRRGEAAHFWFVTWFACKTCNLNVGRTYHQRFIRTPET